MDFHIRSYTAWRPEDDISPDRNARFPASAAKLPLIPHRSLRGFTFAASAINVARLLLSFAARTATNRFRKTPGVRLSEDSIMLKPVRDVARPRDDA